MIDSRPIAESRLLLVGDLKRLGPIVAECFAPQRIDGVHTYLEAIAELPRCPTRAVLLARDVSCRRPEAAIAAVKEIAGQAPVVFCCEPAYEGLARRLMQHGADEYVISPPEAEDLERALRIPSRGTQRRWVNAPAQAPTPTAEELSRLADILPRLSQGPSGVLDAMAALICTAIKSTSTTIVLDGRSGRAVQPAVSAPEDFDSVLTEPIEVEGRRIGQIRVGPKLIDAYTQEDAAKLRHYGVLFARMIQSGEQLRQWQSLSYTDDLTSLPNRRHLIDFLNRTLAEACEVRATLTVLVFDIDDFKRYNDTYGHDAGDEILRDVGLLFRTCCRKDDMVARYGGDEFVVVFWSPEGPRVAGSQHPEGVMQVLNRFREALKKHAFTRLGPEAIGRLTISGGLAHFPWQAQTADGLIEAADSALLEAKKAGKNRFWVVGSGGDLGQIVSQ